ncbi:MULTISPECIES: DUF1450 domain-containing protein [Bacillus]|uniref:DUF1450 domain-containing protein n=1 Tax=Bacillus TaxID=1386 RepID=UPI00037E15C1|nr:MULTISPECIES: DUF1450 domain-containing protein [Bacillus]
MGFIIIEICDSNLLSSIDLEKLLEHYSEVTVMRYECLNICGLCKMRPYALVNGQRVFGKTNEECLSNIHLKIEAELAQL